MQDSDILKSLEDNFEDFCYVDNKLIFIGTYNVAGKEFKESLNLLDWLLPDELRQMEKIPDIYCLGFQEVCKLNASNILLSKNHEKVEYWKQTIMLNLQSVGE